MKSIGRLACLTGPGRLTDRRAFRMLTVIAEYSRQCLAIRTERKQNQETVPETIAALFLLHRPPDYIRSGNGAKFTATAVREWLHRLDVQTSCIKPGSPWENGYNEHFDGKLRDESRYGEVFYTLKEAKVLVEHWRIHYNTVRPQSSLGYQPPAPKMINPLVMRVIATQQRVRTVTSKPDSLYGAGDGPRTIKQLEGAVRAAAIELDQATLDKLDEIFPGAGGEAPRPYAH